MSGGSHGYIYCEIESQLCGAMHDRELNDLMKDIAELAHDLEWYDSSDYGEDDYRESVVKFKAKWFEQSREERLKNYIDEAVDELRKDLYAMIGGGKDA